MAENNKQLIKLFSDFDGWTAKYLAYISCLVW